MELSPVSTLDQINEREAADLAELFKAMGDPSRVRILAALSEGERKVGEIAAQASLSESATSHHLRGLRYMRLVRARKEGREVYYTLDDDHITSLFALGLEHVRHG